MKTLLFFSLCLVSLNCVARVRTGEPRFKVLQTRIVDSIELKQILVEIEGEYVIAVLRSDCNCIVTRKSAISLFGYQSVDYVKAKEVSLVYSIINK